MDTVIFLSFPRSVNESKKVLWIMGYNDESIQNKTLHFRGNKQKFM